jgi:hypothetical protein
MEITVKSGTSQESLEVNNLSISGRSIPWNDLSESVNHIKLELGT